MRRFSTRSVARPRERKALNHDPEFKRLRALVTNQLLGYGARRNQIVLQRALGLPTPRYLHTPLVLGANAEKLSKQNGAAPLDLADPLAALNQAAQALDLAPATDSPETALQQWVAQWQRTPR